MPTTKINLDFGWTCNLVDPSNKLSSNILAITKDLNFVVNSLNTLIKFKAPLDLSISVQPESSNPLGIVNGVAAATGVNFVQDGGVLKPASLIKGQTGRDVNGADVDLGFTIWLGTDGTPRSYGRPIWFDPNPQSWNSSNLPAGSTDFISIALHELVHCLGFATSTNPASPSIWNSNTILKDGQWFFTSPAIIALLGKELPLGPAASAQGSFKTSLTALDHVGNTYINDQPITSDLMYLWGSDELNRLQLGQVDLLVMQALGWDIQNYQNLPLTDPLDFANVTVTQAKGSVTLPPNTSSLVTVAGIDSTILLFTYPAGAPPNLPGLRNGNHLINGGVGIDKVVVGDKAALYKVVLYQDNKYLLQNSSGAHAVSLVNQVERLQFSDTNVALDVGPTQNAGSVYMLYKAAFNRAPDASGMGYWLAQKDAGSNIVTNIAQGFVASKEFTDKYGTNPSNADYVNKLYQNVLGRAGEAGGVTYWNQELNSGARSKAEVLVQFATLPEGAALVANLIANGIQYQEWLG